MIRRWADFISVVYLEDNNITEKLGVYCFKLRDTFGLSEVKAYDCMAKECYELLCKLRKDILRILLWGSENLDPRTLRNV